jgi:hypothetical protein
MTGRLAAGTQARTAVETADTAGSQSHQIRANPYKRDFLAADRHTSLVSTFPLKRRKKLDENYTY